MQITNHFLTNTYKVHTYSHVSEHFLNGKVEVLENTPNAETCGLENLCGFRKFLRFMR